MPSSEKARNEQIYVQNERSIGFSFVWIHVVSFFLFSKHQIFLPLNRSLMFVLHYSYRKWALSSMNKYLRAGIVNDAKIHRNRENDVQTTNSEFHKVIRIRNVCATNDEIMRCDDVGSACWILPISWKTHILRNQFTHNWQIIPLCLINGRHLWLCICKTLMSIADKWRYLFSFVNHEQCWWYGSRKWRIILSHKKNTIPNAFWKACHLFCVFNNSKPKLKTFWSFIRTDDMSSVKLIFQSSIIHNFTLFIHVYSISVSAYVTTVTWVSQCSLDLSLWRTKKNPSVYRFRQRFEMESDVFFALSKYISGLNRFWFRRSSCAFIFTCARVCEWVYLYLD